MTGQLPGHLYGIGVGPGDPELLTLKALRLLRAAPVVAYPAPETGPSFARGIVAQWLDAGKREIAIRFPMRPGPPPAAIYDEAASRLAMVLDRGDDIAFLCQGDPLFYGSFAGIYLRLASSYQVTIVPGVSSLTACAAAAGLPLIQRDATLSVIPATLAEDELTRRLAESEMAAVIKIGAASAQAIHGRSAVSGALASASVAHLKVKGTAMVASLANGNLAVGWRARIAASAAKAMPNAARIRPNCR